VACFAAPVEDRMPRAAWRADLSAHSFTPSLC
jgi:hypothetical protein